jgi:RNA polymerase sigma factor (sigma-70 family)
MAEGEIDLEAMRPGLLVLIRRMVGAHAAAEDLCSEAIRIVLERLRREPLADPDKLAAYLAQTARNLAIAEQRKEARRRTVTGQDVAIERFPDELADPVEDVEADLRRAAVRDVLEHLPNVRDRILLVRYYLEDADKDAICRDLGLSAAHFNRVIYRARERLRELLERRQARRDL